MNSHSIISEKNYLISSMKEKIKNEVEKRVFKEKVKISEVDNKIRLLNPVLLLEMGYSMTSKAGKLIKSVNEVQKNDVITTHLRDGLFESKVI